MSDAQPTPRVYADLAMVRRHLDWEASDADRDADLLLIARAVTEEIERGLGVRWDGQTPDLKAETREVDVLGNVVSLRPPAYRVDAVFHEEQLLTDTVLGTRSTDRGWFRELTLTGWRVLGVRRVAVLARWADDPGGAPPPSVVAFASWATAQDWRAQSSGSTRMVYPEGNAVTIDNAWKTGGRWERLVALFGLPPYKARVC